LSGKKQLESRPDPDTVAPAMTWSLLNPSQRHPRPDTFPVSP
jgi:hypothetical protein